MKGNTIEEAWLDLVKTAGKPNDPKTPAMRMAFYAGCFMMFHRTNAVINSGEYETIRNYLVKTDAELGEWHASVAVAAALEKAAEKQRD